MNKEIKEEILKVNFYAGQKYFRGDIEGCKQDSRKVLKVDRRNAEAYSHLAMCYERTDHYNLTLWYYTLAVVYSSEPEIYIIERANFLHQFGYDKAAINDLKWLLKNHTKNSTFSKKSIYFDLGEYYYQDGNVPEAISSLSSAIEEDSTYYLSYCNRAQICRTIGDTIKAKRDEKKCQELNPYLD